MIWYIDIITGDYGHWGNDLPEMIPEHQVPLDDEIDLRRSILDIQKKAWKLRWYDPDDVMGRLSRDVFIPIPEHLWDNVIAHQLFIQMTKWPILT